MKEKRLKNEEKIELKNTALDLSWIIKNVRMTEQARRIVVREYMKALRRIEKIERGE